jgi:hypothetical protein
MPLKLPLVKLRSWDERFKTSIIPCFSDLLLF